MRPEISNELLLQVIQAWDPTIADDLYVNDCGELRYGEDKWYVRWSNGDMYVPHRSIAKVSELVEFLLKDRPDLNPEGNVLWDKDVLHHSRSEWGIAWASDPFSKLGNPGPQNIVNQIKSYEYLKAWKEGQRFPDPEVLTHCRGGDSDAEFRERIKNSLVPAEVPTTYDQICPYCNGSKEVVGWHGKESCQACS